MSAVTKELRERVKIKSFRPVLRGLERVEKASPYRPGVKICLERARLLTESYKATEGQPMVIRRAKALAHILANMTIYIQPKEKIVGNFASTPDSLTTHPEYYWRWLDKAIKTTFHGLLDEEGKKELKEIHQYWEGKSVQGMERELVPERVKPYWRFTGAMMWGHYAESGVPNYEKIFQIGLNGIITEAKQKLAEIEADVSLPGQEFIEQKYFLQAVIISLEAVINWGKRFSALAVNMAQAESAPQRQKELSEIAEVCAWVPGNPPRTLQEAIQCFWFIHLLTRLIEIYQNGCGVRLDQLLYPIYQKEKEAGKINREQAQELLEYLWIKMEEAGVLLMPVIGSGVAGNTLWQNIVIGGVDSNGRDATNEMSYIILESSKTLQTIQPSLVLRYADTTPKDLLMSAIDLIKTGVGYPALFNDKVIIPSLMALGIPLEDARNYGMEGCLRWTIPGKCIVYRSTTGPIILPKCLELALNQGIDKFSGEQIGVRTPDPLTFTSLEDIMESFLTQVEHFVEKMVIFNNTTDYLYQQYIPRPFLSALLDGCLEKGKDCRQWSYYLKSPIGLIGPIDVANALAAIKKLIFEEGKVTMQELLEALKKNWEEKEELRQICLRAPKYGNDDDRVDHLAREVQYRVTEIIKKYKNILGFPYMAEGSVASMYYGYSILTGATPDGRKDREPFADGTVSPQPGTDQKGPTAVIKSCSKIDPLKTYNQLLNQKFLPGFLEGENKEIFANYLRTWADLGNYHIQFNVVNRETLLDAQKNPEKYASLIVRVAGYSAYFVDLDEGMQNEIIRRTEQHF